MLSPASFDLPVGWKCSRGRPSSPPSWAAGFWGGMKKAVLLSLLLLPFAVSGFAQPVNSSASQPNIIPEAQIHTGMRGVAYTVFEGVKPEPMDVEVLGILRGQNGPKGDIILVRLHGTKPEYTGVVAGMSGSPVYFNGKLAGALAFRIGEFSKEPIAGITPIEQMLEINELDKSRPADTPVNTAAKSEATKT